MSVVPSSLPAPRRRSAQPHARHLRGSMLLLVGRVLSLALSLAVQVVTIRYLSISDFGALAYAMSVAEAAAIIAAFGMDKALARWAAIYHQQQQPSRLLGAAALSVATTLVTSAVLIVGAWLGQSSLQGLLGISVGALQLVLWLSLLIPLSAVDSHLLALFAVFCRSGQIFVRRHLLGPGLRLATVLICIELEATVATIAAAYIASAAVATVLNAVMLVAVLRDERLIGPESATRIEWPWGEMFAFATPLLALDIGLVLRGLVAVVVLDLFHSQTEVAAYRSVLPLARLNETVLLTFSVLFVPIGAKCLAAGHRQHMSELYRQASGWTAVLTFPVFGLTCCFAEPLVVQLLGPAYRDSAPVLEFISLGYYLSAVLGFNGRLLKVVGKLRPLFVTDGVASAAGVAAAWVLIPRYGAIGAAAATCTALVGSGLLREFLLWRCTSLSIVSAGCMRVYGLIAAATAALLVVRANVDVSLLAALLATGLAACAVLVASRHALGGAALLPNALMQTRAGRWLFRSA